MNTSSGICFAALAAALLTVSACNKDDSPTAPTTTDTTPVVASPIYFEDFTGTLPVSGEAFYSFTVTQYGTINVTLAGVGGTYVPSTVMVSLGIGTPTAETCATTTAITTASGAGPQLTGSYQPGVYCAKIVDIGNLFAPAQFTISIAYP